MAAPSQRPTRREWEWLGLLLLPAAGMLARSGVEALLLEGWAGATAQRPLVGLEAAWVRAEGALSLVLAGGLLSVLWMPTPARDARVVWRAALRRGRIVAGSSASVFALLTVTEIVCQLWGDATGRLGPGLMEKTRWAISMASTLISGSIWLVFEYRTRALRRLEAAQLDSEAPTHATAASLPADQGPGSPGIGCWTVTRARVTFPIVAAMTVIASMAHPDMPSVGAVQTGTMMLTLVGWARWQSQRPPESDEAAG